MYEANQFSKTDADLRIIIEGKKCLTFVIEQYFHPKMICAEPGGTCARLDDTILFLSRNLKREELLMEEAGFPDLTAHKKEHETVLRNLESLRRTLVCGNYDNDLVFDFLMEWAVHHAEAFDKHFENFLRGRLKEIDKIILQ